MVTDAAIDSGFAFAWINRFRSAIEGSESELSDLDRQSGDGDFGTNVTAALEACMAALDETHSAVSHHFSVLSTAFMNGGGTSGPLFGVWFRGFASTTKGDFASTRDLASGAAAGLANVTKLGGARVGDKTMVDGMAPAVSALQRAADESLPVVEALQTAALAARAGAVATASHIARRGRASYIGAAGRGVMDPGALAVAIFFESAAPDTSRGN